MVNFLSKFDASGRSPRPIQIEVLKWLSEIWGTSDVIAISAPTGIGKSAVARAIQVATGADIIVPTNQLMDQYTSIYPGVNSLKGQVHYECKETKMPCSDSKELTKECGDGLCPNCPYASARSAASSAATFFNPYSLYYFNVTGTAKLGVLVVDEAHNLVEMFRDFAGRHFNSRRFDLPRSLADLNIDEWLEQQISKLNKKKSTTKTLKSLAHINNEIERIRITREGYLESPENYVVDLKHNNDRTRSLSIFPIDPPRKIASRVIGASKLILLSATLLPSDVRAIVGHANFKYLSLPSPIPAKQREVRYCPAPFPMNSQTDPRAVALKIMDVIEQYPNENVIVHLTYGMAEKVAQYITVPHIRNTPETKDACIEQFKREGGVFLASGCNEGLDLPDAQCRVNVIPMLFRLNPTDPVVKKRLGLQDGRTWYNEQTLKSLIQQAGRSTRGTDDWSVTYVLDPALPRLINDKTIQVPQYFKEAIRWHR